MSLIMRNDEIDPAFQHAVKLLHSPRADSAEKIRNYLDKMIKQRHGPSKMLANTLSEKVLAEESSAHIYSDSQASSSKGATVTDPVPKSIPGDDDLKVDKTELMMDEDFFQVYVTDPVVQYVPNNDDDDLIVDVVNLTDSIIEGREEVFIVEDNL